MLNFDGKEIVVEVFDVSFTLLCLRFISLISCCLFQLVDEFLVALFIQFVPLDDLVDRHVFIGACNLFDDLFRLRLAILQKLGVDVGEQLRVLVKDATSVDHAVSFLW